MILVTGGAGFIGSNIVAALSAEGRRVAVCDWLGTGEKWRNLQKHAVDELIEPGRCVEWLAGRDEALSAVVHMGAITDTTERDVDALLAVNLRSSIELWRYCARAGVTFIYASSAATYGDGAQGFDDDCSLDYLRRLRPLNAYAWSKHLFDIHVSAAVAAGEPQPPLWAGLKFFNVFGPNEYHKGPMMSVVARAYDLATAGSPVRLFRSGRSDIADGAQSRDFIYVDDCVAVVLWLLTGTARSGIFNVGSGEARTFLDVVDALAAATGEALRVEFVETPDALRSGYQYRTRAGLARLRRAGFARPMSPLEQGVGTYVSDFLAADDRYR